MRNLIAAILVLLFGIIPMSAKVLVFWQTGFPTVASQPVARETLVKALEGSDPVFAPLDALRNPASFADAGLLVLPYGSAFPADAWDNIQAYLRGGGNLLILGGQSLRVPVSARDNQFQQALPQDTYSRTIEINHAYELPRDGQARFAWKLGYSFLPTPAIRARRWFAAEGAVAGLGYMVNSDGVQVAAPVIVAERRNLPVPGEPLPTGDLLSSRIVMLDFEPEPGYWESPDGITLVRETAAYARQGATAFWLDVLFSTIKPNEPPPQIVVHLRRPRGNEQGIPPSGEARVELLSGDTVLQTVMVPCLGSSVDAEVYFQKSLKPGFYIVRGLYLEGGKGREFYQNGFWVEDQHWLNSGPVLGVKGDFLTRDGKPFFPVGANYFTTDDQDWEFSGPRNAWGWERDFAEMERHGVSFVRTGVWLGNEKFVESVSGAVTERFLRNVEAFLLCARRHSIMVNFTFFAFDPQTTLRRFDPPSLVPGPGKNPYTDPVSIRAQQDYVLAVVNRFKDVPWLSWDLINEPSFSNPKRLWKGNTPNADPTELQAWHNWLRNRYSTPAALAAAWSVTPEDLESFVAVRLPSEADLTFERFGNARRVRAFDYNLFVQDMFTNWVRTMVAAIRGAGSKQLINVGQDEGGVADRVLNQFYGAGDVSFTTNHSYWRDDALLWDSVAAKRPGLPNIIGETGYQPVWAADGTWRYDEFSGWPLLERKWVLGFAAGNSGILHWDWAREVDFGMKRSDGSTKTWQFMMRDLGRFAEQAAPWATEMVNPQVAIVLPQSLQLSINNALAVEAQQKAVRALYHHARAEAYAVGEYQLELLGNPKLIILPSPLVLSPAAWETILGKVRAGATLLLSGRFDQDPHFQATGRDREIGLAYDHALLSIRENDMKWPEGRGRLVYSGEKTTYLDRAVLPQGAQWAEKSQGKGRILFAPLPLELNDNLQAVGDVYRYALKLAGVAPTYATTSDAGVLICPTRFPHATLYALTSESDAGKASFRDLKSGHSFSGTLDPGRAALLLVKEDGSVAASYNWKAE